MIKQASKKEMRALYAILQKIVSLHKKQKNRKKIRIKGKDLWVYPNVFNPKHGKASTLLLKHLRSVNNRTVLDIGTGSGIYAIFSVYAGASRVVATDTSPYAIRCAKKNIKLHNMEDRVAIRKGDMFDPIKKGEKFDVILANLPFVRKGDFEFEEDYIKKIFIDEKGKFIKSLLQNAKRYLNKDGKILMIYGIAGHVKYLLKLIKKYHYRYKILDTRDYLIDKFYLLELKSSND